jgi:hypothetical protein
VNSAKPKLPASLNPNLPPWNWPFPLNVMGDVVLITSLPLEHELLQREP